MGEQITAWILDAYPGERGMVLWLIDGQGRRLRLTHPVSLRCYADGPPRVRRQVEAVLQRCRAPVTLRTTSRVDFFSGRERPVIELTTSPAHFPSMVRLVANIPGIELFNVDIPLEQLYFYESGLFPLARCAIEHEQGTVQAIALEDSPWDLSYHLPPLTMIHLRLEGDPIIAPHGRRSFLEATIEGQTIVLDGDGPVDLLESLRSLFTRYDPDIILTEWGDSFLIPRLERLSRITGIPLPFNRERTTLARRGYSFYTYGRWIYRAGAQLFRGRLHVDTVNSFLMGESGLEGLVEVARLAKIPVQRLARTTTGTAITSMQLDTAVRQGILIPWRKRQAEEFKSALELLRTDKGGLVYLPPIGVYEDVFELDFASMYPMIMARFNISPETLGCACCPDHRVPEIGYSVCRRRKGLIPQVLAPLIEKRLAYKHLMRQTPGEERIVYEHRQNALKWCLVTCFGYLGYRNARFGRIEAHEAVTAYSRELLLRAKELAESRGFRLLHAIVDSLWIHKAGSCPEEVEALVQEITEATGIPILLEGRYRWIAFIPSRIRRRLGVPNRFVGVFEDGTVKVRGIELRRSDLPPIVREAQQRMVEVLASASTLHELQERLPEVVAVVETFLARLRDGDVTLRDLVIRQVLSKPPESYTHETLLAIAARQLARRGVRLHPGEAVQYVITDFRSRIPEERAKPWALLQDGWSYDVQKYSELVLEAAKTLLSPFGVLAGFPHPDP
ncbi:MAG: DNA polymerase domain-containing protein [Armatimonadota bacterium]|nr:DNA polymerase domain-containing protein [Armatimonadota bacterium]MDR5702080.1 DNA polymerase domain-containing protein [Armatimonadota bacterium]